ncbi:LysM-like peptidoglycan-binding domain-containing protein [Shimwellia pseudoproteus]|uniref:LysM-like peptidoglycan-binding domain-containing protein n=1 Tax=Shimwellia pseudoproteus TaxID=570012 RepID=UPI001E516B0B|nr:LysM-like peptidoglycan-binding domain-containing protein [Shimwellia pseudoproteus]
MRFAIKPVLLRIWHAPDDFTLMDPLPLAHRRGIIAGVLLILLGFLLPAGSDTSQPTERSGTLDYTSGQPQPDPQIAVSNQSAPQQVAPIDPQPVNEPAEDDSSQAQSSAQYQPPAPQPTQRVQTTIQGRAQQQSAIPYQGSSEDPRWRSYTLEAGKTLAQLFRDNNLPPSDVYAMAQVQGNGSPLSSLKSGQVVQIRQNDSGVVIGLALDANGQQVVFSRLSDGSFVRTR